MTIQRFTLVMSALLVAAMSAPAQQAVDIETAFGESDVYILYQDGSVKTLGTAVNYGGAEDITAVDFTLTPTRNGYYILDDEAGLHSFGDAVDYGAPELERRENVIALEPAPNFMGMYFLTDEGKVLTVGDAPFYGEWVMDDAVDIELTNSGNGYIVLYETGELAFFGDATNYGFSESSKLKAVDLEAVEGGYFVLYDDGEVKSFGLAVQLPPAGSLPATAAALSLSGQGYRIIDEDGNLFSFIRPELQSLTVSLGSGVSSVYATTGAFPVQTTPTPRPDTPFFDLADGDFDEARIGRIPEGKDVPQSTSTGQLSLPTGGTFLLLADEGELPREIQFYAPEGADEDETGAVFASLVDDRGGASIVGISYSAEQGMVALVRDFDGLHLVLISGDFEPSSINIFQTFE